MKDDSLNIGFDIVSYAAETEHLKAELLAAVADIFRDTSMGAGKMPDEEHFARAGNLLFMLANRRGIGIEDMFREMRTQARTGLARGDGFGRDYGAVLASIGKCP